MTTKKSAPEPKTKTPKTPKLETGYADPDAKLRIVGLDEGFHEGEPGYDPQLADPDRLTAPDAGYVAVLIERGHDKPVCVVKRGDYLLVVDGRQHVMGARLANAQIDGKADPILVPYYVKTGEPTALDVTRANEWARRDSPLVKARRAARLVALGYKENEIVKSFSDDGARPITKMTLINWKRAANCVPVIQEGFENGDYPITILYEIGKIGYKGDLNPEDKGVQQVAALEAIIAGGGVLKGTAGRANASDAAESAGDDADEDPSDSGQGMRTRSTQLGKEAIRELAAKFEGDDEEPFTDMVKRDGKLVPSKSYVDGDFQSLTSALFAAIAGTDPTGEALQNFPSVYKHVKGYLRSPKDG